MSTVAKVVAGKDTDRSALRTPTSFSQADASMLANSLNKLVADGFALYLKTKNFHWHVSGPNFRDFHLMLDEQADQIFASIDPLAERVRKIGKPTLRSIGHITTLQTISDNDKEFVAPHDMLNELMEDNRAMAEAMRKCHALCDDKDDPATAGLLEIYIDETERRIWFLFEASRGSDADGH